MQTNNVKIPAQSIIGQAPYALLSSAERFIFSDGKRGNLEGYTISILTPFGTVVNVKLPMNVTLVDENTLVAANASFHHIFCDLIDATATPYVNGSGKVAYSIKAQSIRVLPDGGK